jgi:hypothetical protein
MSAAEKPPARRWLFGIRIGFFVPGRTSHESSPFETTALPVSAASRNVARESRPLASTRNVPVDGGAPGFVVVTRSVITTSGHASLTRSARRSSAAGSAAERGKKRMLLRKRRSTGARAIRL